MHMVTETYQLRDGEKLTEFYNGIDWESLFEFVRHYYGCLLYTSDAADD